MRLFFPNLTRPKKAAKHISKRLSVSLSVAQKGIAQACGYRDWYDFEQNHTQGAESLLDQELTKADFIERQASLTIMLANAVGVPDGDAQYALAESRLSGDLPCSLIDQIEVRLECWRRTVLPPAGRRMRGAVGTLRSPGRNGEAVILRCFDRVTTVITEKNVGTVADFEYISPQNPPPMFLPMRLYLPYGYWVEEDGAKVLFSRDYKPLWRLRAGAEPHRLEPSLWIKWRSQVFLWDEGRSPWNSPQLKTDMERFLQDCGALALPILADALPILIKNDEVANFAGSVEPLQQQRLEALTFH